MTETQMELPFDSVFGIGDTPALWAPRDIWVRLNQRAMEYGVVVKVTLRNDHETRKRATDRDVAQFFGVDVWRTLQEHEINIAAYAFRNKVMQVSEAQRITGRTWDTSKKDLERLARRGILEFVKGEYSRDPKAHYRIKEASNDAPS